MKREFVLEGNKHRLYMELADIVSDGVAKEDERSANAFTIFANQLISQFNCISNQPFKLDLCEIKCGEDCEHAIVEITSISEDGEDDAFYLYGVGVTRISLNQSYLAQHLNVDEDSYAGILTIDVWMPHPAESDGDALPVENPLAEILADLACMQYYRTINRELKEWRREYIGAPTVRE